MNSPKRVLRIEEIDGLLDQPLDSPDPVLDALVTAAAKGLPHPELWAKLHQTAGRDDKLAEVAFAYEHLAQDRRIKLLSPEHQAEVFLHAVSFFADDFGDPDGAIAYAERALAASPNHAEAVVRLEALLIDTGDRARLAKLQADLAGHEREADAQLGRLRRALELLDGQPDPDGLGVEVCQRILRLDPSDSPALRELEARLIQAGKPREAAKVLEQALLREPAVSDEDAAAIQNRLVELYTNDVREPHRAIPHVEALLAREPGHALALDVAEALVENRAVAGRAAAALSDAYDKLGLADRAAAMLNMELKLARGPRRMEVQRRLALIRRDQGDPAGALELLGPVVSADPGDDDGRRVFVELSLSLEQPTEAARLLTRALGTCKDPAVRSRVGAEIGVVYLRSGDVKRAEASFQQVLDGGEDERAMLVAARHLADLHAESGNLHALAAALEVSVRLESNPELRQAAARRLAKLAEGEIDDAPRAIHAWQALVDSPWADEALRRLATLYEASGDTERLIEVVERRAQRVRDPDEARQLAFRAAELRTSAGRDRAAALGAWRALIAQYGSSREAHARMVPLLEQEKQWKELAWVLEREVEIAPAEEQVQILGRLAQVRLTRLEDVSGALAAYERALGLDPSDKTTRAAVEKLLGHDVARAQAATVLEPIFRAEEPGTGLVRVLETKAELAATPEERIRALDEAVVIAADVLSEPERALALATTALSSSVVDAPDRIVYWLERVQVMAELVGSAKARAAALMRALGGRPVDTPALSELARAAGEALVAAGDIAQGVDVLRRVLAFEPSSAELLSRIDELLAQQGSPEERMALYRSALERPNEPARRREILHAMAALQQELGDAGGAAEAHRLALADDPKDFAAHQALCELYGAARDWRALYDELSRALPLWEGERRIAIVVRMAEVAAEMGDAMRALAHYRELLSSTELEDVQLENIELLANANNDAETLKVVLERRVAAAPPEERAALLEKLGLVLAKQLGEADRAASAWLEGARLSEAAMDDERARRLFERVLGVAPGDAEAARRLVELYARAGQWHKIPEPFDVVLGADSDDRDHTAIVLALEPSATDAAAQDVFVHLVDAVLESGRADGPRVRQLLVAKARILSADPSRRDQVAEIYRRLLEGEGDDSPQIADAFNVFLAGGELTPERIADRRWLFEWRAAHAADPTTVLMAWAVAEETTFDSPKEAARLYQRVLEHDAERIDAMGQLARLLAADGDAEGALSTLSELRGRSEGEAKTAIELSMASLLLESLGRADEAIAVLESILDAAPGDTDALRLVRTALAYDTARPKAAALLERLAQGAATPEEKAEVLESLLAVSAGLAELEESRGRWYGDLLECKSSDDEAVLDIALRGAQERPTDESLWDAAERAARRLDRPAPVADAYAEALDAELDADAAEELGRRMVEFHEEWFDDQERVIGLLRRVLALAPGASWAFDRLKLAFNAAGRWPDLFQLYDEALERGEDAAANEEILREAAMAAKDFANDSERAIGYLEQLNTMSPGDSRIEASLERLYERQGHVEPLIALLSGRLGGLQGQPRQELRARVAALWLDLADPVAAFELIDAMLADGADDQVVRDLMERLVQLPASRESMAPASMAPEGEGKKKKKKKGDKKQRAISVRHAAAELLKKQYQAAGSLPDVARMLEIELELASTREQRIEGLEAIVELRLGELDDPNGAFEFVAQLVALSPGSEGYRNQLGELAEKLGQHERRAQLLVTIADGLDDRATRISLVSEAAGVRQRELGDGPGAIELYSAVLSLAEDDRGAALLAARELDELLDGAGRPAERCDVLERLAELESEPERRRAALGRAARVAHERLNDHDRATRNWRARLADDTRDTEALDGLVEALAAAERWPELVNALTERAALGEAAAQRRDRTAVARITAEQMGDTARAIQLWQEIESELGADEESFDALSKLLAAEERFGELAEVIEGEVARTEDADRRRALLSELGAVHQSRTGDLPASLGAFVRADDWTRAMEVAATEVEDRDLSRTLAEQLLNQAVEAWTDEVPDASGPQAAARWAVGELAGKLAHEGRHDDVVSLLLRASRLPFSREDRRGHLREAACIASDRVGDPARAIALFSELFADDPADEIAQSSVTRLAKLLEDAESFPELASLWEQQARCRVTLGNPAAAAALWARAADIAENRLQDVDRAMAAYRQGAALGGEASLEALARIHETRGNWAEAAAVLEWLCAQSSREQLAARSLQLAEAYVNADDPDTARERLEQAAATALDAGAVRSRLAALYREGEEWGPLAELLTQEAAKAADDKSRLAHLREAAKLHIQKRNDPDSAVPLLARAIEIDSDDPTLRLTLAEAFTRAGRFEDATSTLRAQVERYGSRRPKDRALVHFQLARVALAADRRAEAIAELDVATKIDPAHPGILQALAKLAFEEGQLERAERMYRALLLVLGRADDEDAPSRAEALLDLSDIAARSGDAGRAEEFVESAFEAALESPREAACLEAVMRQRERYDLVARAVTARLERAETPAAAARALADLAFLHAERLGGLSSVEGDLRGRAQSIHRQLEAGETKDDRAWAALGKVYDWLGDADAEAEVLERRVAGWTRAKAGREGADPFYRLAQVRLADPETRARGVEILERALELEPNLDRADELLRGVLDAGGADEGVVRAYESVVRARGDERALGDALLRIVGLGGNVEDALREGVEIAGRLEDVALSRSLLEAALSIATVELSDDAAAWTRQALADVVEAGGDVARAVTLREESAGFLPLDQGRAILLEVARRAHTELDQPERAKDIYERLLSSEPADREVWEPLLDVYRTLGATERLVEVITQTVPLVDSLSDRARLRLEQANLLLDDDKDDEAADILREILEEDPGQDRAAELLLGLLERSGRQDELTALLVTQIDTAKDRQDVGRIVTTSLRLGRLLEKQGRPDDAFDVYFAVLDWDKSDRDVLTAVLRLAEHKDDPFLIADALEALLKVERGEPALELAERLTALRSEQGDEEGAERALELGFIACPTRADIRDALLERCAERGDVSRAARLLREAVAVAPGDRELLGRLVEAHRNAGEQSEALEILDAIRAEQGEDGELLVARAALLDDLDRSEDALESLEAARALGVDVTAELVAALERALLRAEPPRDLELSLRLVDVLEQAGDIDGARARLTELVRESPKDAETLRRLAALETRTEHWDGAATAYRKLIALEEGDALVDVALALSDACERAGRFADARGGLERALKVAPEDARLRQRLRAMYESTGQHRELAQLILEDAQAEQQVSARLEHLLHAGALLLTSEEDAAYAVQILEEARGLSPESVDGVVLLARGYSMTGRGVEAMTLLSDVVAAHRGRRVRELSGVYQEISRLQLQEGLLDDALQSLTRAFEMDMKNARVAIELGQLALDLDSEEVASRAYRAVTMLRPGTDDDGPEGALQAMRAHAQFQLALIARNKGDARRARMLVTKALSDNPEHPQAQALLAELDAS